MGTRDPMPPPIWSECCPSIKQCRPLARRAAVPTRREPQGLSRYSLPPFGGHALDDAQRFLHLFVSGEFTEHSPPNFTSRDDALQRPAGTADVNLAFVRVYGCVSQFSKAASTAATSSSVAVLANRHHASRPAATALPGA